MSLSTIAFAVVLKPAALVHKAWLEALNNAELKLIVILYHFARTQTNQASKPDDSAHISGKFIYHFFNPLQHTVNIRSGLNRVK